MADYERSEILSTEDYNVLDFTQEEFYLYQKFFKSNSPLVLYFANRNKQLTTSQIQSSNFGHGVRHINVDKIPYVNEFASSPSIGSLA